MINNALRAGSVQRSAVLVGLLLALASSGSAQTGPFADFAGAWSGSGHLLVKDGGREAIRCRATYTVVAGGSGLEQALRCASDSYRFDLASNVTASGNTLTGSWKESSRDINGTVSGRINGGRIEALVEANGFAASVTLKTDGNKQNISIRSQNTELRGVDVSLKR